MQLVEIAIPDRALKDTIDVLSRVIVRKEPAGSGEVPAGMTGAA